MIWLTHLQTFTICMHFQRMLSKLNWEMGFFFLMGMRKWRAWLKKKMSCDKDTSILSSLPVSKPLSYYSIMLKKHQSWYKSDNFGNSLLQGNITQMWGGWGRGDFQICPLSERWPQVSNGCPSEIHYTEKQNIPQQPDLEIYLTSSKSQITILCRHQQ